MTFMDQVNDAAAKHARGVAFRTYVAAVEPTVEKVMREFPLPADMLSPKVAGAMAPEDGWGTPESFAAYLRGLHGIPDAAETEWMEEVGSGRTGIRVRVRFVWWTVSGWFGSAETTEAGSR